MDKHLTLKIQLVNWWADWISRNGNEEMVMGGERGEEMELISRNLGQPQERAM